MSEMERSQIWGADFETTSVANLNHPDHRRVRVFEWSLCSVADPNVSYRGNDISTFYKQIEKGPKNTLVYFHNLNFDGEFILWDLVDRGVEVENILRPKNNLMSFEYRVGKKKIMFRDTMDKFPNMSVKGVALVVAPQYPKLHLDEGEKLWENLIPEGYVAPPEFQEYCRRDAMIVALAVQSELNEGRSRLTSSSEAYHRFMEWYDIQHGEKAFERDFPSLSLEYDEIFRRSYRGGVCAVNPKFKGMTVEGPRCFDIRGMYPSVMSTSMLPYGAPIDFGSRVPDTDLYIVRFMCEFKLKDESKYFPFIQMKNNSRYVETEFIKESNGITELVLPSVAHKMFMERYDIYNDCDYEYWGFKGRTDIFTDYIEELVTERQKYPKSVDPYRNQVYKDLSNMLYGSFALNPRYDKVDVVMKEDMTLKFNTALDIGKPRYMVMATFITAWARKKIVEAIEANYENWVYSDTDSMWLIADSKGIVVGDNPGDWEYETWDDSKKPYPYGKFLRPKTYVLADENMKVYKKYDKFGRLQSSITCAGMPDIVKETLEYEDMYPGNSFEGKLQSTRVRGGRCLIERNYTLKK